MCKKLNSDQMDKLEQQIYIQEWILIINNRISGIILSSQEMKSTTQVQILEKAILFYGNVLGKGMNPSLLP